MKMSGSLPDLKCRVPHAAVASTYADAPELELEQIIPLSTRSSALAVDKCNLARPRSRVRMPD